MIRFSQPLVLLGLFVVGPLLWTGVRRRRPSAILRGLALVSLLLALAGPQVISHLRENYVYFVVDSSGSISRPREELFGLIDSLAVEREHVHYGLILFGAEAALDQGFAPRLDLEGVSTIVSREGTDIAAALKLALESFPEEGGKAIVLLSDGLPTEGNLEEQLARAESEGVRVSVLPLYPRAKEVWLDGLSLPREVPAGTEFPVELTLGTLAATEVRLLLYRDEQLLRVAELRLERGENRIALRDRLEEPGVHRYRAYLIADHDGILENNRLEAAVLVGGPPEVLLLQRGDDGAAARLLEAGGYDYHRASISSFPWEPPALAPYRLVILDNLRLTRLGRRAVAALEGYIEGGGGLLLIQGQRAVEGLRATELEKILPVTYEAREPAQAPSLAIVFVLDRSSSMTGRKIEFLKEAAAASVEALDEQDLIGLVAFDTAYEWIVPLRSAGTKEEIYHRISGIEAAGGTDLLPALEEAFHKLSETEAKLKHIVVFSDGKTGHKLKFPPLVEEIREDKITLSAIAIGERADTQFLRELAERGGGRLYQVKDPEELPRVTLQETERAARERWITGEVEVTPGPYAYLLGELKALPDLGGYVVTYPKEAGEVVLLSERGDPLLSFWNLGLGRVGVLNADLEGRWSRKWLDWNELSGLFTRIVGQVLGRPPGEEITVRAEVARGALQVTADIVDHGWWAELLEVRGVLSSAEGPLREFALEQIAPGRYRTQVESLAPGSYLLSLIAAREGREIASHKEPLTIPYSEEYRRIGVDELLLEEIAAETGGAYIEGGLPEELLAGRPVRKTEEVWPLGILLGLLAFIADLILRKLPLGG